MTSPDTPVLAMFHVKRRNAYRKNTSTGTANLDISESPKRGELSGNSIQFTVAGYQKREPRQSEVPLNSVLARLCVASPFTNHRPPAPHAGTLTRLRYVPSTLVFYSAPCSYVKEKSFRPKRMSLRICRRIRKKAASLSRNRLHGMSQS